MKWHPLLVRWVILCLQETFEGGFYADKVVERAFKNNRKWGSRDRKFIAETVYDMVRWWMLLSFFDQKPFVPKESKDYYRRWAFYEAWKHAKDAPSFLKEHPELGQVEEAFELISQRTSVAPEKPWQRVSYPPWLFEKFTEDFGDDAEKILQSLNDPAPVCLRANTLKTTRDNLARLLADQEILTVPAMSAPQGLILSERKNVFITDAYKNGFFEVQDEASQKVAPLLDPKPGERIADVCAGAGGKTLQLAALMQNKGTLLAGDVSDLKLEQLKIRARRGGVSNLRIQLFDGTKAIKKHANNFDGVLIDAPCTGTGVIRRKCDTKWKLLQEDLPRLVQLQASVLDSYSPLVRKGGRLVYATCSLLHEENQKQVDAFLLRHPDFKRDGEPLITRPDLTNEDGFFAQRMLRE